MIKAFGKCGKEKVKIMPLRWYWNSWKA